MRIRAAITIKGIVQGVGFRPFIFRLAVQHELSGFVRNTPIGVLCEAEGEAEAVRAFIADIPVYKPFASHIDELCYDYIDNKGETGFHILPTVERGADTGISPDLAICAKCRQELFDSTNRRYHYPFINCTNCGPRYSIIEALPYDRQSTSMKSFAFCESCKEEYENPLNRRFHAEPNACADCGPHITVKDSSGNILEGDWLQMTVDCLKKGRIAAIKGIGGYHLAADASNIAAVRRLRQIKHRYAKPFAVMLQNMDLVRKYCYTDSSEEEALISAVAPIVLLKRKPAANELSCKIAGEKSRLGVFLPYTPLHCLIMEKMHAIVLTSANVSDTPICIDDDELLELFAEKPDIFVMHNRQILHANDDSVIRFVEGKKQLIRRSRGLAPAALPIADCRYKVLALGSEQKNTFALSRRKDAFISVHIGDLGDYSTIQRFEQEIASYEHLLDIQPQIIVCDIHPDFHYRDIYKDKSIIAVQHHHAHFASVLSEHNIEENALGIIFDGTGYGIDGRLWGSEFLLGNIRSADRLAHLLEFPLYGGEKAIKEPWRIALALVKESCDEQMTADFLSRLPENAKSLLNNDKWTYSCGMGRLFDAVAAILYDRFECAYEGQNAEFLEEKAYSVANTTEKSYKFAIIESESNLYVIDWRPLFAELMQDISRGADKDLLAYAFHQAVIKLVSELAERICASKGIGSIALSGGCFQNEILLNGCMRALQAKGYAVYTNELIPCNDGGIAYGQLAAAIAIINEREK